MNVKRFYFIPFIIFLMVTASAFQVMAKNPSDYVKTPIILEAKHALPAKLLKGDNYMVENRVQNDGLINTYQLKTNHGDLKIESTEELMIRIAELRAMSVMAKMEREKVFGDALVAGVKAPVRGAVKLVKEPTETAKGVIEGAGRFLSNIGKSVMSDDPYQDNALNVVVGYDAAKRAFAYELGVNPYSNYEPAMSMLGQIAQAAVAGGLVPKAAMATVSYSVATVMQITGTSEAMLKLVRDNPPGQLEEINAAKLAEMGIPKSLSDAFLRNYAYDPQEKTLLVGEMERLKGVKGREEFITAAEMVSGQAVAVFYRVMARMMAGYHTHVAPVQSITRVAGTPCLEKKDGSVVLAVPVDYVFWTAEVAAKVKKIDIVLKASGGVPSKELWLTGKVDRSARQMLEASGWKITANAREQLMR